MWGRGTDGNERKKQGGERKWEQLGVLLEW